jgi:hypothetical protein
MTDLPFVIKKNIRDYLPKLQEYLKRIQVATGKEFFFETDYVDVLTKVAQYQSAAKERLGEILLDSYMSNVATLYVYTVRIYNIISHIVQLFRVVYDP